MLSQLSGMTSAAMPPGTTGARIRSKAVVGVVGLAHVAVTHTRRADCAEPRGPDADHAYVHPPIGRREPHVVAIPPPGGQPLDGPTGAVPCPSSRAASEEVERREPRANMGSSARGRGPW